ncbi:MAG TPA: sigma-70 family RNA polymerase sigma factor [Rhodothermales bacterium]|nr:sigma-70 family RNA polymerase sigma factor [Rhodothermales bacterium]
MPASVSSPETVTALLCSPDSDDAALTDRLLPLVYDELRTMAHRHLVRERRDHTLNTTALVHEAYLKLVDQSQVGRRGQTYFFGAAARAMRQILVDYARRRNRQKRGGGQVPVTLTTETPVAVDDFAIDLLDLDEALNRLEVLNPRQARVVECRFFGGLTVDETAEVLSVSASTVKNDWAVARAWLYRRLKGVPIDE